MINLKSLLLFSPVFLQAVHVPPPPPGGVVERQIEQEYEVKEVPARKEIPLLEVDIPEKQLDFGRETVLIEKVSFSGNTVVPGRELRKAVAPFLGQELSMSQIHDLCLAVQKVYAKKGFFLTRAYTPEQKIENGTLQVSLIEGNLGEVSVVGNKHYSTGFIQSYFSKYIGKPINYNEFMKALLLLNENSDLDVGAVFKKGQTVGSADVVVRVTDKRPVHLMIDHNNYGSDHTSKQRTGLRFEWGNLCTYGDYLTVIEVVGSPISILNFTDLIYHVPLTSYGSSLDLSYLVASFKTPEVEEGIKFVGRSHIATAKFNQALLRTRRLNTDFFSSFDYKQVQNFGGGIQSSYDKLRVLTGGFSLDYIDSLQGRNLVSGACAWGIPDILGGSGVHDRQSSRQGAGGRFIHFNAAAKRIQQMPWDCFFLLNGVGQYSLDKLPLPEQIYIGGIDTVRGYKLAEGLGDHGFFANLELRVPPPFLREHRAPWSKKRWGELIQFIGFIDHGQTFSIGADKIRETVRNQRGKKEVEPVRQHGRAILTSAGVGARIFGPWKFELSFDAGYPLTQHHRSSKTIVYFRAAWNIL